MGRPRGARARAAATASIPPPAANLPTAGRSDKPSRPPRAPVARDGARVRVGEAGKVSQPGEPGMTLRNASLSLRSSSEGCGAPSMPKVQFLQKVQFAQKAQKAQK